MEVRILRYFLAVAREENMTRAAEYLHVTQPTLSKQIKQLEEEVGKKLFIRSNYNIKLTEEGMLLRKRAEDIVRMVDKTLDEFHSLDEINGGDIYIGGAESEAIQYFVKAAKNLYSQYPNIRFHLYSGNLERVTERLDKGLLDFAIVVQEVDSTKYNYLEVPSKDVWGILMRKDSPLAQKESVSIDDLLPYPMIVSRQSLDTQLPQWFGENADQMNVVATYDLIYNASIMVREGFGYALCFDKLVDTSTESELCFVPLSPRKETSLYVIWKKYQVFTPLAELLLEEMNQLFRNS